MTVRDKSGLEAVNMRLKRRLDLLQEDLQRSEVERRRLLGSNSWRITAPLRWLRGLLFGSGAVAMTTRAASPAECPAMLSSVPEQLRARCNSGFLHTSTEVFRPLNLDNALEGLAPPPFHVDDQGSGATKIEEWSRDGDTPLARIGFIGSRELGEELAFDTVVRPLQRGRWREQLDGSALDFVLIETAWEPEGGWRYGLIGLDEEARELSQLLEEARRRGVPTVLWVRETADNAARYAWLMPHVSTVYAADQESARRLTALETRRQVQVLPPAVQPRLHNPVRSYGLRDAGTVFADKVLFDGWWDLAGRTGSNPVLHSLAGGSLVVVDSEWHVGAVRIPDLPVYQDAMLGCLAMREKAALSKLVPVEYLVDSELVPPWRREQRALRAAACGALVVSEPAVRNGPLTRIPSIVQVGDNPRGLIEGVLADPLGRLRTAHQGFREIMSAHCLRVRVRRILQDLGLDPPVEADPRVAAVLVSMRPDRIADCLAGFRVQDYPNRELIVVVHGEANLAGIRRDLREGERVIQLGKERSLADCLNFAMTHTDAPYWAKIDDDDHYGPAYLSDLMLYRHTSQAQVWGKPPMFLHSEAHDELSWDPIWAQHANLLHRAGEATSALVAGGTLAGRREVFETVRFPPKRRGGSDSEFIRQCYAEGLDVLATDGFNFVRFRSDTPGFHTWQASSAELRDRANRLGSGKDVARLAFV